MVLYIPPLSPIMKAVEDKAYLPNSESMRIPLAYLAELFSAGDTKVITKTLQKILDMRTVMRQKEINSAPPKKFPNIKKYTNFWELPSTMSESNFLRIFKAKLMNNCANFKALPAMLARKAVADGRISSYAENCGVSFGLSR